MGDNRQGEVEARQGAGGGKIRVKVSGGPGTEHILVDLPEGSTVGDALREMQKKNANFNWEGKQVHMGTEVVALAETALDGAVILVSGKIMAGDSE